MNHLRRILRIIVWCVIDLVVICAIAFALLLIHLESDLPDVSGLKDMPMQVPLRVYTTDGKLIGEFGERRRIPVPYEQIPPQLINAVLSTEDQRFFEHQGVDFIGLARASVQLMLTGTKSQGGSTITMQVARNFFLTPKKTYTRKLKEILLAMKIEKELSKQKILDLYLNKIYFGSRAYGVAAAAEVYYGKTLKQINLPEIAMIAGLPKAPSTLNPIVNPVAAKERRNHVLVRMLQHGYITQKQFDEAIQAPIGAVYHALVIDSDASYAAEMVRNAMINEFGAEKTYTEGFKVYTTIDSTLQGYANAALRQGLLAYDQRHGYRGPMKNLGVLPEDLSEWQKTVAAIHAVNGLQAAVVLSVQGQSAEAMLGNGEKITLPWSGLAWARRQLSEKYLAGRPKEARDVVKVGDVIRVEKMADATWAISETPRVEGGFVALNPHDGAILALAGGFDFNMSKYNRVTQARRQPGSSFKPFIYAAALAKGYTLGTVINDAPIVITMPDGTVWRPQNDSNKFYGPTRLRVALIRSRNLVSIRLLQMIGISYTIHFLENFGFNRKQLPHAPSLALGTAGLTPLEMAEGYAVFANGGYLVMPYFIDHILDADNRQIYKAKPKVACESCLLDAYTAEWNDPDAAANTDDTLADSENLAPATLNPQVAYMMTSAMKDVVQFGTAARARIVGRQDLAGKTGTTNDTKDAWFAGYNSDIVAVAWAGFDQPKSLYEHGAQVALPIWIDFIEKALEGKPEHTMPEPPGLMSVRISADTGKPTSPGQKNSIFELYRVQDLQQKSRSASQNSWVNPAGPTSDEGYTYTSEPSPAPPPTEVVPQEAPASTNDDVVIF